MKKTYKMIAAGLFLLSAGFIASGFIEDMQYQSNIPVKYLLDGTYDSSDSTFDYYKLNDKEVAVSLKSDTTTTVEIPESYRDSKGVTYTVTGIYRDAFLNKSIGAISIPSTITTIDYEAFMNTKFTSNTKVEIPYSVAQLGTACFFKSNLTEIFFSDGVTQNIQTCDASGDSSSQESTSTKSQLTSIPDYCFAKCESLTNVSFSSSLTEIQESAFEYCSSISTLAFLSGLTKIDSNAFNYCTSLSQVYLPNALVTGGCIADFAFTNCSSSLNFQVSASDTSTFNTFIAKAWNRKSKFNTDTYTTKQSSTDVYANGLWLYEYESAGSTNIKILKYIGEVDSGGLLAFPNTIQGHNVVSIDSDCIIDFESQLKYILLPKTLEEIPSNFFVKDKYKSLNYVGCVDGDNCYTYTIPSSVEYKIDLSEMSSLKKIGSQAFFNTRLKGKVTEIKLPANLENIGSQAFSEYKQVTKISFETGRTNSNSFTIDSQAFYQLGSDKESSIATSDIVFPKELTSIGSSAFEKAKCLRNLTFEGDDSTATASSLSIGEDSFFDCSSLVSLIIKDRTATTTIGKKAFAQWNGNYRDYTYKPSLQTVYLPKNISFNGGTGNEHFGRAIRCTFYCSGSAPSAIKDAAYYFANSLADYATSEDSNTDDMTYTSSTLAFKLGFTYRVGIYENVSLEEVDSSKTTILHTYGDFSYVLDTSTNTAVVSRYHFNMESQPNKTELEVEVPSSVSFDGTNYTVNEIGTGAFGNSDSYDFATKNTSENTYRTIKTVILPDTIRKIGHYAFFRCVGLENVGVKKEENGTVTYEMPSDLTYIGQMAFGLSGIKKIVNLNSNCDFYFYGGTSQLSASNGRDYSSPFMNCPQLESITLRSKDNSKIQVVQNGKALADSSGNILVVFPKYSGTDTSFISTKFYYGAYRTVSWIKTLTISSADFPSSATNITPQAIFAGYNSKKSIREKCRFKSRATVSKMDNEASVDTLKLTTDSTVGKFVVPTNFLYGTKVKTIYIPYGGGDGTFPASLFESVSAIADNNVVFRVQKEGYDSEEYTNGDEKSNYLDLTDCGYTNIDAKAFYQCNLINTIVLPSNFKTIGSYAFAQSSIQTVTVNGSLTSIGDYAFYSCSSLTTITFPDNLTYIGSNAFNTPDGSTPNSKLTTTNNGDSLFIPKSVATIGSFCFRNLDGVSKVEFEKGSALTEIPQQAFDNCDKLSSIVFPDNLKTIGSIAFWGAHFTTLDIPDTVETIKSQAFEKNEQLTSITIPSSVTKIENSAFNRCTSVTSIEFVEGDSTIDISDYAFANCYNSNFTSLNLTGRTFKIGSYAFQNCNNLTSVTIGGGVVDMWNYVFQGDSKISSITFEEGTETLNLYQGVFSGCSVQSLDFSKRSVYINKSGTGAFSNCKSLKTVIFGSKDTYIGSESFSNCSSLQDITFGAGVKTIVKDAFKGCTALASVDLSKCSSLTEINGFSGCTSLSSVTYSSSVTSIGEEAFKGCSSLTLFDFASTNLSSLGKNAFANSGLTSINVTSSLTSVGEYCFSGCTSLTSAKFSSKAFKLSNGTFSNCSKLKSVIFLGSSDGGYDTTPFAGCTSLELVVLPSGFDISLKTKIFEGLTNLSTTGNGVVCLSTAYDSSKSLGDFTKISETNTVRIAYQSASGSVGSGTLIWEWTDDNKTAVNYYDYNSSSAKTEVPTSIGIRKKDLDLLF
jgi:hypothetical protein